jgi:hypothetical protein
VVNLRLPHFLPLNILLLVAAALAAVMTLAAGVVLEDI